MISPPFFPGDEHGNRNKGDRAMPFLSTEPQLGHLTHHSELSYSAEFFCAAQKIISSQQKGPNMRKSDKVLRRVESRSPEKGPKGLSTLSLDKRRLRENVRASTMSCFSSMHRTKWWKTQGIFRLDLESTSGKACWNGEPLDIWLPPPTLPKIL